MKHRFTTHLTALAAVALLLFGASQAFAGGTDSGETISNSATIDYKIGTVSPPSISSTPAEFVVDYKIDPVVANNGGATVVPNGTGYALTFTVTNNSNTKAAESLQLKLTTEEGANTFNMDTPVQVWEDDGDGIFSSGSDTNISATPYISLAKDADQVIFIVADAPGTAADTQTDVYHLIATAWDGNGAGGIALAETGGNTVGLEDIIFVDAAGTATVDADAVTDGKHSDSGTYTVGTAQLSISKSSAVIGGTGYYIPGETVEYTITISNGGGASATATGITVSDSLDTEITAGTVAFSTGTIKVDAPNLYGGAETTLTDADGDDEGNWNITGTNTVTVNGIELDAGESATVKFQVEIQ
ncbi:DUF11 domain-containing protein [Desulfuromonas sp. TF]|uniref:DUF11 domain-containing protein n=1 Tax=Desulfuromonas sp. TF TaxID=1232410 RepID=UPI000404FBA7|nr:DUF11 domain-containing protein [Desulfuromonas sp. TF]